MQDLKRELEGEDYKLPVPKKPERQEFKPSGADDGEENKEDRKQNYDFSKEPATTDSKVDPSRDLRKLLDGPEESSDDSAELEEHLQPHLNDLEPPTENTLEPDADENEDGMNPYERALRDNEKHKKRFVEELKREAEERK